ncbi:ABC transporter permease [Lachnospiraceae bacterium 48-42]
MLKYIIKRILQAVPLLLLITLICFTLINLAPYDAIDSITTPDMSKAEIEAKREAYGLNDPLIVQYGRWVVNILKGDFGYSLLSHTSIKYDLKIRIPATIKLVLPSYLTAYLLSIVLGLVAGSHKNKWPDKLIDGFCSVGISMPTFWFAMIVMYFFGYKFRLFPLMGMHTIGLEDSFADFMKHFIMPYVVLTVGFLPDLTRYVRGSTVGQLKEDYVIVQQAFGAKRTEILFKHVGKNVLIPLITKLGMALPMLVTGAVITETIFSWPGIGSYFVKAISAMDYPIVMSILVLSGTLVILGNLLSDVLYCLTDPRIKTMKWR